MGQAGYGDRPVHGREARRRALQGRPQGEVTALACSLVRPGSSAARAGPFQLSFGLRSEGCVEHRIEVSFPSDGDGFIGQQCPSCAKRFKVRVDDESDHSANFCPYCGIQSDDGWLTEEQEAYAMGVASEQGVDPMLED